MKKTQASVGTVGAPLSPPASGRFPLPSTLSCYGASLPEAAANGSSFRETHDPILFHQGHWGAELSDPQPVASHTEDHCGRFSGSQSAAGPSRFSIRDH